MMQITCRMLAVESDGPRRPSKGALAFIATERNKVENLLRRSGKAFVFFATLLDCLIRRHVDASRPADRT
jgi:hypothetical protein